MLQTIKNAIRMRDLAVVAVAGLYLGAGAPAQACTGPVHPNSFMGGLAPNLAVASRLLNPGVRSLLNRDTGGAQAQAKNVPSIVGLWQTSFLIDKQVVDQGFETYHSDGSEILVDIAPPATDNVCIGTWVQTGMLTYSLTHPSWTFDMSGNLTGTAMIMNSITLSHDGDKFTGKFTVDIFDVNGKPVQHLEGDLSGERIKPQ